MSAGGPACRNSEHRPFWRIADYRCNHSAFNGYHYTPSDYSAIVCQAKAELGPCNERVQQNAWWRTKAAYVEQLADPAPDGAEQPHPEEPVRG